MAYRYRKDVHGFTVVHRTLDKNLLRDDFLQEIDAALVGTGDLDLEQTVLLGDVDNGRKLPNWFPFKVQYQFDSGEQVVSKLLLIANNARVVFLVTGHAHDLATIFARYSRLAAERAVRASEPAEVTT